jgi:hypothetical protein
MRTAADKEQIDAGSDSGAVKDEGKIFLGAIMGRFSAPNDTPRERPREK